MPPKFVVGEVLPIGGVVPGVVLGVVPGVVEGVVPGVVLGVVPDVVPVSVLVVGMAAGVLGGHSVLELDGLVVEVLGMVALGLFAEGLAVLMVGELELTDGVVEVTGHGFEEDCAGDCVEVVAEPGLAICVPLLPAGVELDCVPGTTGVGVIAPVCGACAMAMATAKNSTTATSIVRVVINLSWCGLHRWDGRRRLRGCSQSQAAGAQQPGTNGTPVYMFASDWKARCCMRRRKQVRPEHTGDPQVTAFEPEYRGSRRDPEERPARHREEVSDKMLDKTLADSFPTSDPPSSIPDPCADDSLTPKKAA